MGTFLRKMGKFCSDSGATIHTIGFNAGVHLFALPKNCFLYQETQYEWQNYIRKFLKKHEIDIIFLFGNCRLYHKEAALAAKEAGVDVLSSKRDMSVHILSLLKKMASTATVQFLTTLIFLIKWKSLNLFGGKKPITAQSKIKLLNRLNRQLESNQLSSNKRCLIWKEIEIKMGRF